jgi:hypothetical protein
MAVAYVPIDEEEEQQGQPQQGAEKVLSGESSTVGGGPAGGSGGAQAAQAPKATSSGTGWSNLTSYVKANEGQDARMGGAVKDKYQQGQSGAQSTVTNYDTTANQKVQNATVSDSGLVDQLNAVKAPASAPLSAERGRAVTAPVAPKGPAVGEPGVLQLSLATTPAAGASTPSAAPNGRAPVAYQPNAGQKQVTREAGVPAPAPAPAAPLTTDAASQFATQTAGYKGPEAAWAIDGYGQAKDAVATTEQMAGMANDFEGRRTFLKDIYGEPRYNAGEQRLDSFITGAGAGGRAALDDVQKQSGQFKSGWEELVNRVSGGINTARTTTEDTKARTLDAYKGAVDRTGSAIKGAKGELEATTAADQARYDTAVGTIVNGGSPAAVERAWKDLGLAPDQVAEAQWLMDQGLPIETIVARGQAKGLGDVVGKEDQDLWSTLSAFGKEGGMDPLDAFEFKSTGGAGGASDLNEDLIEGSKEYRALEKQIKDRYAGALGARNKEYDDLQRAMVNGGWATPEGAATLARIGVTPEQIAQAVKLGISPRQFLSAGTSINAGDVATDEERGRWGDLLSKLGISSTLELGDSQNEGSAYGFDKSGFLNALAANTAAPTKAAPKKKEEEKESINGSKIFNRV